MESSHSAVVEFFEERHIRLKPAWLDAVLAFLRHRHYAQVNPTVLCNLVYEQWLHADLSQSSEPCRPSIDESSSVHFLESVLVLQIKSILDVSKPFYSQVRSLTNEFVDNSGFEAIDENEKEEWKESKAQRMFHLVLSNGGQKFKAFELERIRELTDSTKPGAKVLLLPPLKFRKGHFLLERDVFQVLGGDVDRDMEEFNPVKIMAEKLGMSLRALNIAVPAARHALAEIQQPSPTSARRYEAEGAENEDNGLNVAINRSLLVSGSVLDAHDFEEPSLPSGYDEDLLNQVVLEGSDSDSGMVARRRQQRRDQLNYITSNSPIPDSPPRQTPVSSVRRPMATAVHSERSRLITSLSTTPGSSRPNGEVRNRPSSSGYRIEDINFDDDDFEEPSSTSTAKKSFLDMALGDDNASSSRGNNRSSAVPLAPLEPVLENRPPRKEPPLLDPRRRKSTADGNVSTVRPQNAANPVARSVPTLPPAEPTRRDPLVDPRRRRTGTADIRQFVAVRPTHAPSSSAVPSTTTSPFRKKVKVEIVDLSSDEEIDVKPIIAKTPQTVAAQSSIAESPANRTVIQPEPIVPVDQSYVALFKRLSVISIADAVKRTRFMVGSIRCRILAIVVEELEPLRVVDGMWTKKIVIKDTSTSKGIACYVDDTTLTQLVGWTPEESERVRNSTDTFRRQEGARRIKAADAQFSRLDLLMDVEFFSGGVSDPVIRRVATMIQVLDELSLIPL